ncbi:MAG: hypothetical protein QNJ63_17675 [Calothrix sp. MO_192.B10]|nr:hypothetical protein [Calothrix sp. MO_192.B10]
MNNLIDFIQKIKFKPANQRHIELKPALNLDIYQQITKLINGSRYFEWVQITTDKALIITEKTVFEYYSPNINIDEFLTRIDRKKLAPSIHTTSKLLDSSIILAKKAAKIPNQVPSLSLMQWIWYLANQYHLTHMTSRLMKEASLRFSSMNRTRLAHWAEQKAHEESGHDRLALLDIQSLGYDPKLVVKSIIPVSAKVLLNYFTSIVQSFDPIGCIGYLYTLERLAISIVEEHIQMVEAILPLGTIATRCLRLHSGVGLDVEHVQETIKLVANLSQQERNQVAISCYETASLYFKSLQDYHPSDEEIEQLLAA